MDIDSLEATTLRHRTSEPVLTVIVKCQGEIQAMQNEIHSLEEKVNEQEPGDSAIFALCLGL